MNCPTCRFCSAPLTQTFVDLGESPLANAFVKESALARPDARYPLHAWVCGKCFLVQVGEFQTPGEIFSDYAYFSSYSTTWLAHCRAYAEKMLAEKRLPSGGRVVEIASNDGALLQFFQKRGVVVLGIEPAANVAAAAVAKGIPTEVCFFGQETAERLRAKHGAADLLVANNVLAHVPRLNDFVRGLAAMLAPTGLITIELPSLQRLMEECQFDTIYHEHFSYFSLSTARRVLQKHGLQIYDVEELPTHGGSLRLYARHAAVGATDTARLSSLLEREKTFGLERLDTYAAFPAKVQRTKKLLLDFLRKAQAEGKKVAAYGAPAKGNTLLNFCGIGPDLVTFTVDLNPHKQGTWLPGSRLPVRAPEAIRKFQPDYLLILPWNLREEIIGQMSEIRSWGGKFVVPVPETTILP